MTSSASRPSAVASRAAHRSPSSSGICTWVSGSPKRTLNSSTRRPSAVQHQPGVQAAGEADAPPLELVQDGRVHLLDELGRRRDAGHRRVGAHAAGVRALVAVADPLVVLRRGERHAHAAVAQGEQRDLLADEPLLDHQRASGIAERAVEHRASGLLGLLGRAADDDALAGGEPVGLDHRAAGHAGERRAHLRRPSCRRRAARSGTPAASITSLAKAFDPSSRAASRPGPNTARPTWRSASASPATSGASGPITTSPGRIVVARSTSPSTSSSRTG